MGKGQVSDVDVVGLELDEEHDAGGGGDEVAVGEDDSLGHPRAAARVHHDGRGLGCWGDTGHTGYCNIIGQILDILCSGWSEYRDTGL